MTAGSHTADGVAIGWHGKLPTVGDFVTRRMDIDFVSTWDTWMSRGLIELRERSGNRWLDDYLKSPTWRFLSTPGFLPTPLSAETWAGVVMPSVDRVGRYYPLTLASPLTAIPDTPGTRVALWTWMQRLEDIAIDALEGDWSVDALDGGLIALGLPPNASRHASDAFASMDGSLETVETTASLSMKPFFAAISRGSQLLEKRGCCVWCCTSATADPRVFLSMSVDDSISRLWSDDLDDEATRA